jgi:hypothetical protein
LKQQVDIGRDPREIVRKKQADQQAAKAAARAAEQFTLRALLDDYIANQKAIGRSSHRDAATIFKLHVYGPWPELVKLPANEVTGEHIADMMRRVIENGHGRTANKLRNYVRAAFQMAKAARSKPTIPLRFKDYMVTANPADDTAPDESANKPDKRPLDKAELRSYRLAIRGMDGFKGAVLRLHLLTGGQRIEQLVKLRTTDTTATKRIGSGVETVLAAARVNSDTRGRLQSHGVAGVQARHYDGHDYMDEKRQALESLFALLDTPEATNVVMLNGAPKSAA